HRTRGVAAPGDYRHPLAGARWRRTGGICMNAPTTAAEQVPQLNRTADFPILSRPLKGRRLVYLDNGATTQKPTAVIQAESQYYEQSNANIHRGVHWLSQHSTDLYEQGR